MIDIGSKTYDVGIVCIDSGIVEVKGFSSNSHFGGDDFDDRLVKSLVNEFKKKHKKDLSMDDRSLRRLRTACERAKRTLSSSNNATVMIDSLFKDIDFCTTITRERFDELSADLYKEILIPIENVLENTKLDKSCIHEVVLVGGTTRIPKIQNIISHFFNDIELVKSINPDEAIAVGAAIQAAIHSGDKSEKIRNTLLLDIYPHSLGIENETGSMSKIIERNASIPIKTSKIYKSFYGNQSTASIPIYEGEGLLVENNILIGQIKLCHIENVDNIKISFSINEYGILNISVSDKLNK
eukprot:jgi/Orpsp1_1/1182036/evm.model.c7180000079598.1